jgi:hypothetical protein
VNETLEISCKRIGSLIEVLIRIRKKKNRILKLMKNKSLEWKMED